MQMKWRKCLKNDPHVVVLTRNLAVNPPSRFISLLTENTSTHPFDLGIVSNGEALCLRLYAYGCMDYTAK